MGPYCINDCALIDPDTCLPLSRKALYSVIPESVLQENLYDEAGCYNSSIFQSTEGYSSYETFSTSISVLTILTGIPGLAANIFCIAVLTRKEMKNCFNHILIAVNICDSLHVVFAIFESVRNSFMDYYPQYFLVLFPYIHYPLYRITLCASIYLIIGVAIERYLAVCRPHHYREVQTQGSRAFLYILPSLLLALAVNTSRFLETETASVCVDFSSCMCSDGAFDLVFVKPTALRLDREYIIYYGTWGWIVMTGLIPFLVLLVLNTQIYVSLKELRRKINQNQNSQRRGPIAGGKDLQTNPQTEIIRERRLRQQNKECNLTIVLLSTVIMFFVCHLPRILTSVHEAVNIQNILGCREKGRDLTPLWLLYIMALVQYLQSMNACVTLPIYLFASKGFQTAAVEMTRSLMKKLTCRLPASIPSSPGCCGGEGSRTGNVDSTCLSHPLAQNGEARISSTGNSKHG